MTNIPKKPNGSTHIFRSRKWTRIIIISGLGLVTVSVAGGIAGTWFVQKQLVPIISENLNKQIQRPVLVGELKKFGLGYIEFGPSSIPPTLSDSISASTKAIKVKFSLGAILLRTVRLDITFEESQAYLQQQPDGLFAMPKLKSAEDLPTTSKPLNFDVKVNFPKLNVTIKPSEKGKDSTPILLDLSKTEFRFKDKEQRCLVNLNSKVIDGGNFKVNADANLKTSEIKANVVAKKLQLPMFATLVSAVKSIPDVNLYSGELDANLRAQVKIADNITNIVQDIRGKVSLQEFKASSSLFSNIVNLNTVANVVWPKVNIESFNGNYGNIGLKLQGAAETAKDLDLQNIKLDLQGTVLPVSFETLFNTATTEINLLSNKATSVKTKQQLQQISSQIENIKPLLEGRVKTDIKFSGSLFEPVVSGKIETTEVTRVDRLRFKDIATKFTISPQLNQDFQPVNVAASFSGLQINPVLGGKITGQGTVLEVNPPLNPKVGSKKLKVGSQGIDTLRGTSLQSQDQERKFNPTVDLDLRAQNLPVEAIAQQYNIASPVPMGEFSTEVKISGPLETLKGQIKWQLPKAVYPLSGDVDIINSQANIKNTVVKIGGGTVNINGNANLENWQLSATANEINLDNLAPLQPLGLPSGLEGILNGQANFSGLISEFSINSINGKGTGIVNLAGGQINLNSELNNGNWQGEGIATQLSLSALEKIARNSDILITPNSILSSQTDGIISGQATVSGNLNNLSLAGLTANLDGNLNLANGIINANGKVNNGGFQVLVNTQELPVNPLLDLGLSVANSGIITNQENLNLIRTNIPQVKSINGRLNGKANLSGNLTNLSPEFLQENLTGNFTGNLKIEPGTINATGNLKRGNFKTTVQTNKIALNAVEELFTKTGIVSPESKILQKNTEVKVQGGATVFGNINNLTPEGITINGNGKVIIPGGTINAQGELNQGNFQASVNSSKLAINPLLDLGESILESGVIPVETNQIQTLKTQFVTIKSLNSKVNLSANFSGSLTNLAPEAITAIAKSQLFIDENSINIDGKLNQGNFLANVETEKISLRPLEQKIRKTGLISLPTNATLPPGIEGEIFGNLSVFANVNNFNTKAIAADGSGKLIIGNNTINATGKLDKGNFAAVAIADPIPLSFIKKIAKETGIVTSETLSYLEKINGNIIGNAKLAGNLENLNPEAIAAEAEGKLIFAEGGAVNITGELVGEKWQAAVVGDQIPLEKFSAALEKQEQVKPAVTAVRKAQQLLGQAENLPVIGGLFNSQIDLLGSLTNLTLEGIKAQAKLTLSKLPIIQKSFNSLLIWNQKQIEIYKVSIPPEVNVNGVVGVDFPVSTSPTISGININVNLSDFNLASLPIEKLIEKKGELLTGRVNFDGKIIGKSIADLNLVGDVVLRNLAVNKVDFDSELSGKLNAGITQGVNFEIAGNNDRIKLVLDETYAPSTFLVKRDKAKLAGVTEEENFLVTLEKFPLEFLGIVPAEQFGIGAVSGEASAKIAVSDLRTFLRSFNINSIKADGNLEVTKPSIGYIDAESFTADINYAQGKASLNDGTLLLGESRYVLQTMVDINSPGGTFDPKFAANLKIEKGEAQDILTALQWFDLKNIERGVATPNYGKAADVQTSAVGFPENTPVIMQLRRFAEIQALLQQQQESQEPKTPVEIPPLSDLDVTFSGEIMAEGSLQSGVDGKFDIKGSNWSWGIYKIDNFLVQGKYKNEVLTVKPLEVEAGEASLVFHGNLSPENQSGKLQLKNVDLAEMQKFAESYIAPNMNVNITGKLNLETELGGNFENPRARGEIKIVDGTLNEQPIEKAQTDFSYNSGRLRFDGNLSVIGDPILYRGDVPIDLPFATVAAGSDLINVSVNVKDDAFQIVNILTDQVTLDSGKGNILLKLKGTLQEPRPEGYAKFVDVNLTAAAFSKPLTDLKGTVLFNGDRLEVKEIQGNISDGVVEVSGVLPLSQPLSSEDPDINNPLTIILDKLNVDFQKAFKGGIDGKVVITGAASQPDIGGQVEVSQGEIFVNQAAGLAGAAAGENKTDEGSFGVGEFNVGLNDFQLLLSDSLQISSLGLANIQVGGGLRVNGTLSDIRPSGMINLEGGTINLFSTELRLDRSYENTAKFIPNNGIDPMLDIQLLASAFETSGSSTPRSSSVFSAETIDAPSPGTLNSSQRIKIMAKAKGLLSELSKLENDLELIELTSSPQRTETQIVSLLSSNIVDTLSGDRNLALANVASTALFSGIQQDVIKWTGLSEFRIFPASIPKGGSQRSSSLGLGLEVGIDVTDQLGVSATILDVTKELFLDYQVNDKVRLRGGSNFDDNAVLSIEYETRF